jgi:hypothetical protein
MTSTSKYKKYEITVFISRRESICDECKENIGPSAWITLDSKKNVLCLSCADLDHLVFLPSGDAALTRRSSKYSVLSAVVVQWSRARKRYERQGLLVEEDALGKAENECLADADARELKRQRAAETRTIADKKFMDDFAQSIRLTFPYLPKGMEKTIAHHACQKYSGRVGRSQAAKVFDDIAIFLAVQAHARHTKTNYDELLIRGYDRHDARNLIDEKLLSVLKLWKSGKND